jgi:branched-subunit amino acid ABC-type transport system permease component
MVTWLNVVAFAMAALSAVALYAASPHCMWKALRGKPRAARIVGTVLALLSLLLWTRLLGGAGGLCAMLVSWMLALAMQPYLALLVGTPDADVTAAEQEP